MASELYETVFQTTGLHWAAYLAIIVTALVAFLGVAHISTTLRTHTERTGDSLFLTGLFLTMAGVSGVVHFTAVTHGITHETVATEMMQIALVSAVGTAVFIGGYQLLRGTVRDVNRFIDLRRGESDPTQ